ncbi:conserved hypothetical protein [Archaeoglobus fulgidus DSM 4304]|jgi:hypothetical protein|uniref:Uncharacterized protein AF_1569 n=3 Tax=Archaeoglobus fulgidus TaxID=2234 RepID=Y1569_ARCFU|nr:RecName: Full=Uncharacterized protein AF_1569 [Archaeoglobus fulgidus DSM 4304]AAB89673.1 conserved hypothetical protein [Archaeoglobus fulgidus DSM 4304]KUJ92807.1 MAG: hypothetical protein XD40_2001 [Archaeoglobus fulgidus]
MLRKKLLKILSVLTLFIFFQYVAKFGILESLALSIVYVLLMEILRDLEILAEKRVTYKLSSTEVTKYVVSEASIFVTSLAITFLLGGEILDGLAFGFFFLVYLQWFYNEAEMERVFNDFPTFPKIFLIYRFAITLFGSTICFYRFVFGDVLKSIVAGILTFALFLSQRALNLEYVTSGKFVRSVSNPQWYFRRVKHFILSAPAMGVGATAGYIAARSAEIESIIETVCWTFRAFLLLTIVVVCILTLGSWLGLKVHKKA